MESAAMPGIELVLYVSADSVACQQAVRVVTTALDAFRHCGVALEIRNVSETPLSPADDPVVLTPTLVVRRPRHVRVIGELDAAQVERMLLSVGARRDAEIG